MSNIETGQVQTEISERERELTEKLGSRLLLMWLLVGIALVELLVIVDLARR